MRHFFIIIILALTDYCIEINGIKFEKKYCLLL